MVKITVPNEFVAWVAQGVGVARIGELTYSVPAPPKGVSIVPFLRTAHQAGKFIPLEEQVFKETLDSMTSRA